MFGAAGEIRTLGGGEYLMLHRTKKENDCNRDKWIGIGGKFEEGESPEECALRETKEETGLALTSYRYRGIVTFVSDKWESEYMHLFTADGFEGTLKDCDEGELAWIKKKDLLALPAWEGDKIFLRLLDENIPFFSLKLRYEGETLAEAKLNGKALEVRADLRRNVFPPPDRGRRRDSGGAQGTRYHHIWRERRGKAVSVDNFCS